MPDDENSPLTAMSDLGGAGTLEKIYNRYNTKFYRSGNPTKDPSDAFSQNIFLDFYHVASKNSVKFMAFLKDYNETYDVNTESVNVYGRADPIQTYQNTQRNISLTWIIPSRSPQEAIENVNRLSTLIKFLYPAYKPIDHVVQNEDGQTTNLEYFSSATTLSKPPLMRIKYANIISNSITAPTKHAKTGGLLGFVTSLNHSFDMEAGGFDTAGEQGAPYVLPKEITVTVTFKPIHEHPIGWASDDKKWIGTDDEKHKIVNHFWSMIGPHGR